MSAEQAPASAFAGQAVVTGASGALGSAVCRELLGHGLEVTAVARDAAALAALVEATGADGGLRGCAGDVTDAGFGEVLAAAVPAGPVRMVVHAVGLPPAGPTATVDPDALGQAVAIKAGGLLRMLRALDDRLVPGSRVVAVGGHFGSEPSTGAATAGVANAALANLVRQLADLYGPRGVTVHLVAPGPLDTPRLHRIAGEAAAARGVDAEVVLAEYRAKSPLGRLVGVEQVSALIGLLLSPAAEALHGSTLALDGGARRGIF